MFDENLVFLDIEAHTYEEVLKFSYDHLQKMNFVENEYLNSILQREKVFPTGLKTHVGIDVAIPHTEAEFARKEVVVFIRTKQYVRFNHMVDPDEEVFTRLIFNIVVKNPKKQVVFLTKFMKVFQNKELLTFLSTEIDKKKIIDALSKEFNLQEGSK